MNFKLKEYKYSTLFNCFENGKIAFKFIIKFDIIKEDQIIKINGNYLIEKKENRFKVYLKSHKETCDIINSRMITEKEEKELKKEIYIIINKCIKLKEIIEKFELLNKNDINYDNFELRENIIYKSRQEFINKINIYNNIIATKSRTNKFILNLKYNTVIGNETYTLIRSNVSEFETESILNSKKIKMKLLFI